MIFENEIHGMCIFDKASRLHGLIQFSSPTHSDSQFFPDITLRPVKVMWQEYTNVVKSF